MADTAKSKPQKPNSTSGAGDQLPRKIRKLLHLSLPAYVIDEFRQEAHECFGPVRGSRKKLFEVMCREHKENKQKNGGRGEPEQVTNRNSNLDQPARDGRDSIGISVSIEIYEEFSIWANEHFQNKGNSKTKFFEVLWRKYKERKYGGANS